MPRGLISRTVRSMLVMVRRPVVSRAASTSTQKPMIRWGGKRGPKHRQYWHGTGWDVHVLAPSMGGAAPCLPHLVDSHFTIKAPISQLRCRWRPSKRAKVEIRGCRYFPFTVCPGSSRGKPPVKSLLAAARREGKSAGSCGFWDICRAGNLKRRMQISRL